MTKRSWLLTLIAFGAIGILGYAARVALTFRAPNINADAYDRIHVGMTVKEVEEIVNSPSKYDSGEFQMNWEGRDLLIKVQFRDGKVIEKGADVRIPNTFFDKVCKWLHLPWW